MRIALKKFGTTLTSRQAGSEAAKAFQPTLRELKSAENLEIDFDGVLTFAPSWGDEFLSPLLKKYGGNITLLHTENPSVQATLKILKQINGKGFSKIEN